MGRLLVLAVGCVVLQATTSFALVNPNLLPEHLFERHAHVLGLTVVDTDIDKQTVTLKVQRVYKGRFTPETVTLTAVGDEMTEAFFSVIDDDDPIIAFVGTKRKPQKLLFYASVAGRWQGGTIEENAPQQWNWTEDYDDQELYGTFSGHPRRLAEMMADGAAGRWFFPARVFDRFKADQVIGTLDESVRGVALYDLNGDGQLDVYGCSEAGDRVFLQTGPLAFADRTKELGLAGAASRSVSIADANADGRPDLLLDNILWQQTPQQTFQMTSWLAAMPEAPLHAGFADVNRDGYPDVLASYPDKGICLYLNRNAAGGAFTDATAAAGFDRRECGAGGTGWLVHGDWSNDGRIDLFYSSGDGFLLIQHEDGTFRPFGDTPLKYDFAAGGRPSGLTGAGCFAPVWRSRRPDLIFSGDSSLAILVNEGERILDGTTYGNETQISSAGHLPLIAEDLNADGNVDIYVGSRSGKANMYYLNRGYGSFMVPDRYSADVFAGPAHRAGAWGLAAGDVNHDGANDLLIGGVDGRLTLLVNDTLSLRVPKEHPTSQDRVLAETKLLAVHVRGKLGVCGATLVLKRAADSIAPSPPPAQPDSGGEGTVRGAQLSSAARPNDEDGQVFGRRTIGANVATGCRGPDTINFAVRQTGNYKLQVRYSDGYETTWAVDLSKHRRTVVTTTRDDEPSE